MAYAEPMEYEWTPLAEEAIIAVLPENHRLAGADAYPVKDCETDNIIMTSWGKDREIQQVFKEVLRLCRTHQNRFDRKEFCRKEMVDKTSQ